MPPAADAETEQPDPASAAATITEQAADRTAAQAEPPIVLEPGLHEIFRNEAGTHLEKLEGFLARCRSDAEPPRYDADLERALHTLHGSAHMAEVDPIAGLAGELERYVAVQRQLDRRVDAEGLDVLTRGMAVLRTLVGVINQPGAALPDWQGLGEEVHSLWVQLEEQLLDAAEPSALSEDSDAVVIELLDLDEVPEPSATEAENLPSVEGAREAFDPELLEIFMEEARELAERMDSEFQAWVEAPDDGAPVADLQRTLHTFKGGARLAGITALGDLSHALESLFEAVVENTIPVTRELQRIARRGVDHLAGAVEQLQTDGSVAETQALVGRIEGALRGDYEEAESILVEPPEPLAEATAATVDSVSEFTDVIDSTTAATVEVPSAVLESSDEAQSGDSDATQVIDESPPDPGQVIPFPQPVAAASQPAGEAETLPPQHPAAEPAPAEERRSSERIRVSSELLDQLVNGAGEISIHRARLEQQNNVLEFNLQELDQTVTRLREQLRRLEIETETQILSRYENEPNVDFDPLELDRYSTIQELSRALSETVSDLGSIGSTLQDLSRDTETLLLQHTRVTNELQDGLLRTRMVPFGSRVPRLQRVVRQTAETLGKQAELEVEGEQGDIDRTILESVVAPLEHLLRNAVAHGIESPQGRAAAGKPEIGRIELRVAREGTEVVIRISDDGAGLDRAAIRRKAIERGLLDPNATVSDTDLDAYILAPGFSTSAEVSQIAGRGVGMDVVQSEVKQLGGSLFVESTPGNGATFTIRLPYTLAISEGLLVQQGEDVYAVPHGTVDGVTRVSREDLEACYAGERETIEYAGIAYQVRYLGTMLGVASPLLVEGQKWYPVLLVRTGDHRVAVQVDELLGNRQVVVKSLGPQLANIRWFTGATILADGKAALILDINSLVRMDVAQQAAPPVQASAPETSQVVTVMVVDDSITVRKVTTRLLERHNMQVVTAKDGVDAIAKLQDNRPDVMLLDIEMPRMDGFELARHIQHTPELSGIPIVMITSRTGDKHRDRAMELGVKRYLGKPYQEADLLENIYGVLGERDA
jgi:chemosensory pili system protein ChpA (sensor histidine kinase/response regulator)